MKFTRGQTFDLSYLVLYILRPLCLSRCLYVCCVLKRSNKLIFVVWRIASNGAGSRFAGASNDAVTLCVALQIVHGSNQPIIVFSQQPQQPPCCIESQPIPVNTENVFGAFQSPFSELYHWLNMVEFVDRSQGFIGSNSMSWCDSLPFLCCSVLFFLQLIEPVPIVGRKTVASIRTSLDVYCRPIL